MDTHKVLGYFLACICKPEDDLEIALSDIADHQIIADVVKKERLNADVVLLGLRCREPFSYRSGQFINLMRQEDDLVGSYSLASLPDDNCLELHVKRISQDTMSIWVHDTLAEGDQVAFFGPAGDSFYVPHSPQQGILMVGIGTGLAPLYGILRDALRQGHQGPINLIHGSLTKDSLYLVEALQSLADEYANVHYLPCVLEGEPPSGGTRGSIDEVVLQEISDLAGWRVFLCGDPYLVQKLQSKCFLAGAKQTDIHIDPFISGGD